jgi:DNA repair protein RecO (recombination protein O)
MKRGLYKTQAVVLNSFDYGESDSILNFYTEDYGKLGGIAKGARRSRRRFVGNIEPMSHVRLVFFHSERSELVRVEEVALVNGFSELKLDIEALSVGYYLLELVSEMTREGQAIGRVFSLLTSFLGMLNSGGEREVLLRFFEIKLLSVLGYMPHLNGCVVCGGPLVADTSGAGLLFSSEKGGVVCTGCSEYEASAGAPYGTSATVPVSLGTVKVLSSAVRFDFDKLARLKPGAAFLTEGERLLDNCIKHQIGKELKTKKFLAKLRSAPQRGV